MLLFIKNFLTDAWTLYPKQIVAGIAIVAILIVLLLSGCAGTPKAMAEGPGYCAWKGAPAWMAKDIISDPKKFGIIDGFEFVGKHGLPCYAIKVDKPPADGTCDTTAVVCETGNTDDRWGPNTPLVVVVGQVSCDEFDGLIGVIKKGI